VTSSSGITQSVSLSLALDIADASSRYQVQGADVTIGQVVTLTTISGGQTLIFNNAQAGGGSYDLVINRVTASGEYTFTRSAIIVGATDTQYLDTSTFEHSGVVTLTTDLGSTGTVTQTMVLTNGGQGMPDIPRRVYVPLIVH
jgi:hypothetical protein